MELKRLRSLAQQVHFLIDTGASTTAISRQRNLKRYSKPLKPNSVGQFNVQTANGVVRSPMYQFASLEIAQAKVRNINVMVLPLDELGHSDGLLGMNFACANLIFELIRTKLCRI
ncbi:retropepsin-like aspartic protease [Paraglaciecola sp. Hal342]